MSFNKDEIKNNLSIEQVFDLVNELGGNPIMMNGFFTAQTICHNPIGEGSRKLYYYDNSHLFQCYTNCDFFDIFELVEKVKKINLYQSVRFVASFYGFADFANDFDNQGEELQDWKYLNKSDNLSFNSDNKIVELKTFDNHVLDYYPQPRILDWEREGISYSQLKKYNIKYDPVAQAILIPYYDINNQLIGIRQRTLVKDDEIYGKYRPACLNGILYNHPLGFSLYNLNNSQKDIKSIKKAIVFESEKSVLQLNNMLNIDIGVAVCGSSMTEYQFNLLAKAGAEEIIIGFDKQFKKIGDEEFKQWTKKLEKIHQKYSKYRKISFLFDKFNLLQYKSSPTDEGKEKFLELFNKRILL